MRIVKILAITMLVMFVASDAFAERRAGLGGKFAARHMTAAQGSLTVIGGPDSTQILGERFGDAGIAYEMSDCPEGATCDDPIGLGIGAAYGITPELEAGAFLPLGISPDFEFNSMGVFATYAKDMGNFDVGGRIMLNVPIDSDKSSFGMTVGVPALFRFGGKMRLDTGLFIPIDFEKETVNDMGEVEEEMGFALNIPVRFGMNFTPKIFAGVETGIMKFDLVDGEHDMFLPLGFFGGYTMLAGGRVIDIGLSATWDSFMWLNPPDIDGIDSINTDSMRINMGANVQMQF